MFVDRRRLKSTYKLRMSLLDRLSASATRLPRDTSPMLGIRFRWQLYRAQVKTC